MTHFDVLLAVLYDPDEYVALDPNVLPDCWVLKEPRWYVPHQTEAPVVVNAKSVTLNDVTEYHMLPTDTSWPPSQEDLKRIASAAVAAGIGNLI